MEDRISTLPSNIAELILMRLPVQEAVRTSILSSRWRYQWCTIPHIIFERESVPFRLIKENIVDQVLLLHSGPIHKFSFEAYSRMRDMAIDRWLVFLSRNNLKELHLRIYADTQYKLPTAFYSCHAIVSLELDGCEFKLPSNFTGFSCLTTLLLENISISDTDFSSLISKCSVLRKLVISNFYCYFHLKLNAPKLQELKVEGVFADLHLEHTPNLVYLSLGLDDYDEVIENEDDDLEYGDTDDEEECYFNKCLSNIPKIETLLLRHNFLDFMTRGPILQFPVYTCLKMVILSCLNFLDLKHIYALQSLLQNTPMLQMLEIEADSDECLASIHLTGFHVEMNHSVCLENLQIVRLSELVGVRTELEFIKYILFSSPRLNSLLIKLDGEAPDELKLYKEIMRFRRASSQAEIVILD